MLWKITSDPLSWKKCGLDNKTMYIYLSSTVWLLTAYWAWIVNRISKVTEVYYHLRQRFAMVYAYASNVSKLLIKLKVKTPEMNLFCDLNPFMSSWYTFLKSNRLESIIYLNCKYHIEKYVFSRSDVTYSHFCFVKLMNLKIESRQVSKKQHSKLIVFVCFKYCRWKTVMSQFVWELFISQTHEVTIFIGYSKYA